MDDSMLQDLVAVQRELLGAVNVQGKGGEAFIIERGAPSFKVQGKGLLTFDDIAALQRKVGDTRLSARGLRLIWATEAFVALGDTITAQEAYEYSAQVSKVSDVALFRARVKLGVEALDEAQSALGIAKVERALKAEANKAQAENVAKRLKTEWELASQYGMTATDFTAMVEKAVSGSLVTA